MQPDPIATAHANNAGRRSPFFTTAEAGIYLGLSRRTLEKMRTTGTGPLYRKHGRYVRYHLDDLDGWSASRQKNSTSEAATHTQNQGRDGVPLHDIRRTSSMPIGDGRLRA
jgi:excisionase family DNA binding protein